MYQSGFCCDNSAQRTTPKSVAFHKQHLFLIYVSWSACWPWLCWTQLRLAEGCGLDCLLILGPMTTRGIFFFFLAKTETQEGKGNPAWTFKASAPVMCVNMSLAKASHGALLNINETKKHTSFTQVGRTSKPHGKGCKCLNLFQPNILQGSQNTLFLSFITFVTVEILHLLA